MIKQIKDIKKIIEKSKKKLEDKESKVIFLSDKGSEAE